MENKKNGKKIVIACIVFAVLIASMILLYNTFKPKPVEGSKKIEAEVILADGTSKTFEIHTDAEFLREALEQNNLISGTESDYGLYVTTVNSVTANESKQEWWCFTVDGKTINTSVDSTPVNDGDHFEITLKTGF